MPHTAASKIVYPDAGSIEPPHVHYAALAESTDPRCVGIARGYKDIPPREERWRGSMWYLESTGEHVIQTGHAGAVFGSARADSNGLVRVSDLMLSALTAPDNEHRLTPSAWVIGPRVLGSIRVPSGHYKPGGDAEDPFIVKTFAITVPAHPLSKSGQWLLMAQISAFFYNTKWNAKPPDKDNPDDERAQTNLEVRIARRKGDEPTRIAYCAGPPQGHLRQVNTHIGVAQVEGDSVLQGDVRALRFPTDRNREFKIENPAGQTQGWVLGIPLRI